MAKKLPLISVLVCNYNYGKYISETLDSILAQKYPNIEIVIVDDGSKDDSVRVIQKYVATHPDAAITLVDKKHNQGICFARNDALDLAEGDFFIFLDSDDTVPVDYVSKMYELLVLKRADVVYGDVIAFGAENYNTDYPDFDLLELMMRNYINVTSLVRKAAIGSVRFDEHLNRKTHEDYDFWLALALKGLKFVKAKNTYLNYRIQPSSRNANRLNMKERTREVVEVWKYSFEKYQKQFPGKLPNDVIFKFYDHQLSLLGDELMALNDVVQEELVPELKRREDHIEYLANKTIKQLLKERVKEALKKNTKRAV